MLQITVDPRAHDSSWEDLRESLFFFPFFYSRALRFSPPSALLFLTPSHGRPNLLLTLLSGWTRGFLRGLATRSFLRWAEEWWEKWRERPATYHRSRLLWWLRMKDDITRSVVIRCHRPYWFGDRLSSGGAAAADCVCCLFSPLAFLAWCNWHRAYWSGNYCNARDSLGQVGWGGDSMCTWGVTAAGKSFAIDGAQLCFSRGGLIRWGTHALPRITPEYQKAREFTGNMMKLIPVLSALTTCSLAWAAIYWYIWVSTAADACSQAQPSKGTM